MAADPYKYFRVEARELLEGLTRGALELEKGGGDKSLVGSLLRLAHTLKGASRVVKQPLIADLAHGVEDVLSPYRDTPLPVPGEQARVILNVLDQIGSGLAALGATTREPDRPARQPVNDVPETLRVEADEVEALLNSLAQAGVHIAVVHNRFDGVKRARRLFALLTQQLQIRAREPNGSGARVRSTADDLAGCLDALERDLGPEIARLQREFTEAQELANRLRLLPASSIFPALARTARDAAVTLGKRVELYPSGGEIRLDPQVLGLVRSALLQLVRNAVAHGIETGPGRASAGKPACGRIDLRVERRSNRVAFICRDDGAGIDIGAIRRAAVKRGMVSEAAAEALGMRQAIELLLQGGLSTSNEVDSISGRGVGLDVVREAVTRLKGNVSIDTAAGQGASVEICVPVSLASAMALDVDCGGVRSSIPLSHVRRTLRIAACDVIEGAEGQSVVHEGRAIPFFSLSAALGGNPALRGRSSAVIVQSGDNAVAVGVDRLIGAREVLMHSVPALAAASPVILGASEDVEGNPQLILNPETLVEIAGTVRANRDAASTARLPILVIDDSLTTRMVEQSILESAGYPVEVAGSGEEAFVKAHERPYSLFLVDVEMPGMDGFEFVSRARQDPILRKIPSILVTSRNSPEDRQRGVEAGARSYLVKSDFDHGRFLRLIEELAIS